MACPTLIWNTVSRRPNMACPTLIWNTASRRPPQADEGRRRGAAGVRFGPDDASGYAPASWRPPRTVLHGGSSSVSGAVRRQAPCRAAPATLGWGMPY
eukprot:2068055-Prymnesium_polylepis.2